MRVCEDIKKIYMSVQRCITNVKAGLERNSSSEQICIVQKAIRYRVQCVVYKGYDVPRELQRARNSQVPLSPCFI